MNSILIYCMLIIGLLVGLFCTRTIYSPKRIKRKFKKDSILDVILKPNEIKIGRNYRNWFVVRTKNMGYYAAVLVIDEIQERKISDTNKEDQIHYKYHKADLIIYYKYKTTHK